MLLNLSLFDLFAFIEDNTKGLKCFAKAHVVAKGAVQIVFAQLSHPVNTFFLIVSQLYSRAGLHRNDQFVLCHYPVLSEYS